MVRRVPAYERVRYSDIYKGIDLEFYGNNQRLEYDLLLKPEADPGQILFSGDGAKQVELDKQGNLVISHQGVRFTLLEPFDYQSASAGKPRQKVDIDYEIHRAGPHAQPIIGFHLGHHDRKQSLVIDPVLIYGTYIPAASVYSYPPLLLPRHYD